MKADSSTLHSWRMLYDHGDYADISNESGINRDVISNAVKTGTMNEKTYEAIQKFYNARRQRQEALIRQSNPEE